MVANMKNKNQIGKFLASLICAVVSLMLFICCCSEKSERISQKWAEISGITGSAKVHIIEVFNADKETGRLYYRGICTYCFRNVSNEAIVLELPPKHHYWAYANGYTVDISSLPEGMQKAKTLRLEPNADAEFEMAIGGKTDMQNGTMACLVLETSQGVRMLALPVNWSEPREAQADEIEADEKPE